MLVLNVSTLAIPPRCQLSEDSDNFSRSFVISSSWDRSNKAVLFVLGQRLLPAGRLVDDLGLIRDVGALVDNQRAAAVAQLLKVGIANVVDAEDQPQPKRILCPTVSLYVDLARDLLEGIFHRGDRQLISVIFLARLASPVFHVDRHDPPLLLLHGDQD